MKKLLPIAIVITTVSLVAMEEPTKKSKAPKQEEKKQPQMHKRQVQKDSDQARRNAILWGLSGIR